MNTLPFVWSFRFETLPSFRRLNLAKATNRELLSGWREAVTLRTNKLAPSWAAGGDRKRVRVREIEKQQSAGRLICAAAQSFTVCRKLDTTTNLAGAQRKTYKLTRMEARKRGKGGINHRAKVLTCRGINLIAAHLIDEPVGNGSGTLDGQRDAAPEKGRQRQVALQNLYGL